MQVKERLQNMKLFTIVVKKWKSIVNNDKCFETLLTYLTGVFTGFSNDLLTVKPHCLRC